jgi:hypothetical protein
MVYSVEAGKVNAVTIPMTRLAPLLESLGAVNAWLAEAAAIDPAAGLTADNPIPLRVGYDLSGNADTDLSVAIFGKGRFVALDCSAATTVSVNITGFSGSAYAGMRDYAVSFVIPDGITGIANGSSGSPIFDGFAKLREVRGKNITAVGICAFYGCTTLESVSFPAATDIGSSAFHSCTALTGVSLPAVTTIDFQAFYGCTALTAISLPASLTTIDDNSFGRCIKLTSITVAAGNPNYKHSADGKMLLTKDGKTLIGYPAASGPVTLNGITTVGNYAFSGCTGLTTISLPAATDIGSYAFYGCTGLTTVTLPTATSIGQCAFASCTSLTTVTLGDTAPTLGWDMFYSVDSAQTVTVKVPSGAAGYGTVPETYNDTNTGTVCWGNGFRGRGWTGAAFVGGSVNSYITLKIEEITP